MKRVVLMSWSIVFLAGCSGGMKQSMSPLVKPTTAADVNFMRSTYHRTPVVVFIGDGITQAWITQEQSTHPTWINAAGTDPRSVETSGSMLARFQTDVIALHPDIVHILAGTFDLAASFVIWPEPCGTGAEKQKTQALHLEKSSLNTKHVSTCRQCRRWRKRLGSKSSSGP